MQISGNLLIGQRSVRGSHGEIRAIDPTHGATLEPVFGGAAYADLDEACALAAQAFDTYRETSLAKRSAFLEAIADNVLELGDTLIARCMSETGLPRARIEGERARTVGQLRMFAALVREGDFLGVRIDPAMPERQPMPRVDLRLRHIALGPVGVFGASNFPLAFSVAGGDTASALAAGCPVVVKAHSAHPGTSELVGRAIQRAVHDCGMPEGTFSLLFDSGLEIGQALVNDARIKAVGFTGSRRGGTALMGIAAARAEPIPVYAEMSSINPVLLFPQALSTRAESIAREFAAALTMGSGQFCTNPGLILAVEGPELERFIAAATAALTDTQASPMLTPDIHRAYETGVERMAVHPDVVTLLRGSSDALHGGRPALFATNAEAFRRASELHDEIFGASSLIVRCPDLATMRALLERLDGQLTVALHIDENDHADAQTFVRTIERRAGRIVVNGFGTGVEVGHAMVHGGPYPATSNGGSSSVGSLAIKRFLRPVSYQDMPEALLPDALKTTNPLSLNRRMDGKLQLRR
ncbi:aldehyde dehydrogenase (NADP(+)) [Trinickia mobilis]|uniref:aldehyde dehydrogenase (NADP(+)) n=1 Tax=Trinickia mobilis TaxID=2816356 RepID=UPI001A8CF155|nr:aldehyde dehydrogenase (NADP(+)) [Trinickia mobilis]